MKKIKVYIMICIFLLLLFNGCSPKIIVVQNHTIETITIKEDCETKIIEKECPSSINDCSKEIKEKNIEKNLKNDCIKRLNICNILSDKKQDYLDECMIMNNSKYSEDLLQNLSECKNNYNNSKSILEKIKRLI